MISRGRCKPGAVKEEVKIDEKIKQKMMVLKSQRRMEEYDDSPKESAISEEIDSLESVLRRVKDDIKEHQKYVALMKKYSGSEWKVFSLKVDIRDGLCDTIKRLEKEGVFESIKVEIE